VQIEFDGDVAGNNVAGYLGRISTGTDCTPAALRAVVIALNHAWFAEVVPIETPIRERSLAVTSIPEIVESHPRGGYGS